MTRRSLERRLAALQAKRAPAVARVLAWQDIGEPGLDADTVQLCVPGGNDERMPLDEWRRRYPDGMLIRVVYGEQDAPA